TQSFALETTSPKTADYRVQSAAKTAPFLDCLASFGLHELDTARVYCGGDTETVLGQVGIKGRFEVSTKVYPEQAGDHTREKLHAKFKESLKALGVSKVRIFYLHAPDFFTPFEETAKAVDELYREGLFEKVYLSNFAAWQTCAFYNVCKQNGYVLPTVYQGWYNPLMRQVERELFPCLREYGIHFYAYNPIAGGFLTGSYHIDDEVPPGSRFDLNTLLGPYYREQYWSPLFFDAVQELKQAADAEGIELLEASIRWMKHHSGLGADDGLIFGANDKVECLAHNLRVAAHGEPLPESLVKAFDAAWDKTKAAYHTYFRRDVRYLKE
ncbi:hypothetical protein BGW41_002641, partial [Actinomortierella wolfii]